MKQKTFIDPYKKTSEKRGFAGILETFFRSFRKFAFLFVIAPIALLYVFCLGMAAMPSLYFNIWLYEKTLNSPLWIKAMSFSMSLPASYFISAVLLLFVVGAVNKLLPLKLKPMRTTWYSLEVIPWYYHNALVQLVRYTVLDFMTPSPLNVMFYRMMGMKVGKNVMINTTNISDPALITLEDNVMIGGSATLFAHYGMKGFLVVAPLVIKKNANIGLKASLFGDVVVEEGALVGPGEVVLPKSVVEKAEKKAS